MIRQDSLKQAVGAVLYEVWMLRDCILMEPPTERVLRNLWYEGIALHSRVLRDFFFKKPNARDDDEEKGDILAVHFFSDPAAWRYTSDDWTPYLQTIKDRHDRALAHLSYQRFEFQKQDKDWAREDLAREIGRKWFEFLAKLDEQKEPAAVWFRQNSRARLVRFEPPF